MKETKISYMQQQLCYILIQRCSLIQGRLLSCTKKEIVQRLKDLSDEVSKVTDQGSDGDTSFTEQLPPKRSRISSLMDGLLPDPDDTVDSLSTFTLSWHPEVSCTEINISNYCMSVGGGIRSCTRKNT